MISDELQVHRFNVAVLLLGCFLLSSIVGLAYGEETPPVTLATDKSIYSPGDTVYVTVSTMNPVRCVVGSQLYVVCLSVVMIPVQSSTCGYSCPTASANLLLRPPAYNTNGYVQGYQGKVVLQLSSDTPAGRYYIETLACAQWLINGNMISCGGQVELYQQARAEIRVEGPTSNGARGG